MKTITTALALAAASLGFASAAFADDDQGKRLRIDRYGQAQPFDGYEPHGYRPGHRYPDRHAGRHAVPAVQYRAPVHGGYDGRYHQPVVVQPAYPQYTQHPHYPHYPHPGYRYPAAPPQVIYDAPRYDHDHRSVQRDHRNLAIAALVTGVVAAVVLNQR